jgi:hypothetical protein
MSNPHATRSVTNFNKRVRDFNECVAQMCAQPVKRTTHFWKRCDPTVDLNNQSPGDPRLPYSGIDDRYTDFLNLSYSDAGRTVSDNASDYTLVSETGSSEWICSEAEAAADKAAADKAAADKAAAGDDAMSSDTQELDPNDWPYN